METFCNVPLIIEPGAAEYRKIGTERSPGPKLFCVSGQIEKPGLYEVPFGVTLRHLLFDLAGGLKPGRKLQAVLMGGAAGAFATEKDLDVILSFEDLRAADLPLGSGAVMVFDDRADLRDVLKRLAHFFADESCGKCYPCQLGARRQYEILERTAAGKALTGDPRTLSGCRFDDDRRVAMRPGTNGAHGGVERDEVVAGNVQMIRVAQLQSIGVMIL